jgi:L,D-transpeptidase ErfK/SrfK
MKIGPIHLSLLTLIVCTSPNAATFDLPPADQAVIGEPRKTNSRYEDTLVDIARLHSLGYDEIRQANPSVDPWLPGEGTEVVLPTRFVLPDAPREGLVINVAEMRLYYYPTPVTGEKPAVVTYPISIGRGDWQTPLATTKITAKVKDPTWYPPESVRKEHAADGDPLPKMVPPGPDNPLGRYALRMGLDSYLIHGTNKPFGIGMQVTHGCIRLYPEHIEALFEAVPVATPVRILNQPYKAGWHGDELYLEVHAPLSERKDAPKLETAVDNLTPVVSQVIAATRGRVGYEVDWDKVHDVVDAQAGIPVAVTRSGATTPASTSVAQVQSPGTVQAP